MNWPNLITITRMLLMPTAIYLLWEREIFAGAILFLAIMLGDMLDGYVARKLKQVTKIGGILDSFADRLVIVPTFVILVLKYDLNVMLTLLLLTRDIFYLGGFALLLFMKNKKKYIQSPLMIGKITTLMLTLTAVAIILDFYKYAFIIVSITLSVISSAIYFGRAIKRHKEIKMLN